MKRYLKKQLRTNKKDCCASICGKLKKELTACCRQDLSKVSFRKKLN